MANLDSPWFPIIFSDKCDGCVKTGKPRCVEYCPNGVFTFQNGKAVVAYPAKCVNGCTACVPLCHNKAISFPKRNITCSQLAREAKNLLRKTTCRVCGKQYWTNIETDVCFDCEKQR